MNTTHTKHTYTHQKKISGDTPSSGAHAPHSIEADLQKKLRELDALSRLCVPGGSQTGNPQQQHTGTAAAAVMIKGEETSHSRRNVLAGAAVGPQENGASVGVQEQLRELDVLARLHASVVGGAKRDDDKADGGGAKRDDDKADGGGLSIENRAHASSSSRSTPQPTVVTTTNTTSTNTANAVRNKIEVAGTCISRTESGILSVPATTIHGDGGSVPATIRGDGGSGTTGRDGASVHADVNQGRDHAHAHNRGKSRDEEAHAAAG
jgi:hypothetical protein